MYTILKHPDDSIESIKRETDGAFIPADEHNGDYQAFLAWCAEGNQPEVIEL